MKGLFIMHDPSKFERDIETLKDNENKVSPLGASFGVSFALNTIAKLAIDDNPPRYDTFLINISTLIRDNFNKTQKIDDIKKAIYSDTDIFLNYIEQYCQPIMKDLDSPYVVLYVPSYKSIPQEFKRIKKSDSYTGDKKLEFDKMLKEEDILNQIIKETPLFTSRKSKNQILDIYVIKVGISHYPHKELLKFMYNTNKKLARSILRRILMFSHHTLDFHIFNEYKYMTLLEGHTGKLKSLSDLSDKVFKNTNVPFNRITHPLLGDKIDLNALIKNKEKDTIFMISEKNNWTKKTTSMIATDVKRINVSWMNQITKLNL
jgi:hypothetical protein